MYAIGEHIVYERSGVCKVADIMRRENPATGEECDYYVLEPLNEKGVIYTPVDNPKVFMRPILTAEQVEELIDQIPLMKPMANDHHSTQQLIERYRTLLGSHDCSDLISLVVTTYAKKEYAEAHNRHLGNIDRQFMDQARDLISTEFGMALGIPKEEVDAYIAARVEG